MKMVPIQEAAGRLAELVAEVRAGESIVLTQDGEAVAELNFPTTPPKPRRFDRAAMSRWKTERGGESAVSYISPDFDDPLPADFLSTPGPA